MNKKALPIIAPVIGLVIASAIGYFFLVRTTAQEASGKSAPASEPISTSAPSAASIINKENLGSKKQLLDKLSLWTNGTELRGANIYQRRVYIELDGTEFMGPGPLGPPLIQEDFNKLSKAGANLVVLSHPGLFDEKYPYALNKSVQDNLDKLIQMAQKANLFVVIVARTGPGRSEFTIHREEVGTWFDKSYINDDVWTAKAAQAAYVAMWRYTAQRYHNNPVVVGYELMTEPNSQDLLGISDPEEFYPKYENSTYDWNALSSRISAAIREVDNETPILIGGMGYSAVRWLPYLKPTGDKRTVYTVHQYEPQDQYTHQNKNAKGIFVHSYPGRFDTDGSGAERDFDKEWIDELLKTIDSFKARYGAPVAVTEYGVMRWEPGAEQFINDELSLFEKRGLNYAIWEWVVSYKPVAEEITDFNFRFGPDEKNKTDVASRLYETIKGYWQRGKIRPSLPSPVPQGSPSVKEKTLKDLGAARGLRIGGNYDSALRDETHDKIFAQEFNALTVYSAFFPSRTESDFSEMDHAVNFGLKRGMEIFGQSLVWFDPGELPNWVKVAPKSDVEAIMNEHIDKVVGRYKGKIKLWNVVNEAVNDGDAGTLRQGHTWAEAMGDDYIRKAFVRAHMADPNAILYYNDYEMESNKAKYDGVKVLLIKLKSQGAPVHALGWQMHVSTPGYWSMHGSTPGLDPSSGLDPAVLLARLNEIADLGFDNYITELDVELPENPTPQDYEEQKQTFKTVVETFLKARRHKTLVLWGLRDGSPYWLTKNHPLLFDEKYQKKPAYFGIQEALLGE